MTRSQPERRSAAEPEIAPDVAPEPTLSVVPVASRGGDRRIAGALWAVAVLIVVAIVKPWGVGAPQGEAPRPHPPVTPAPVTPAPTADLSADGLANPICLGTGGWRIASLETWETQDVRVWRAIEPVPEATGPLDPRIPSVPIVAVVLTAVGWCAPAFGPERPVGPTSVTAWTVVDGHATELTLRQVQPASGTTPIAALYVPLTRCPEPGICVPLLPEPVPARWWAGRIVFRFVDAGAGRDAWFAADVKILDLDARASSPTR
jgi:hypothetical protein